MATKVAIQYGVVTGPWVGKKFRRALTAAGYRHVEDIAEADIIITHSAGCFWLPPSDQPLLLINPLYWPGKTIRQRVKDRARSHRHYRQNGYPLGYWLGRTWWGVYYGIVDYRRTRKIMNYAEQFDLPQAIAAIAGRRVVIVRNDKDDWLTPDLDSLRAANPKLSIISVPGDHDNCWYNPEPYIAAIRSLV
ncbi:MAG: hypothetical protein JWN82_239 [Candidatus Saccharibacteria bacterium]|nr:hypothetical protein [Candidatus Saccharibacteria bacterium]